FFFFSSRRRHTRCLSDWSSDVCSSDLFEAARELSPEIGRRDAIALHAALEFTEQRRDRRHHRAQIAKKIGTACDAFLGFEVDERSEERRVGKECRCGWGGGVVTREYWV